MNLAVGATHGTWLDMMLPRQRQLNKTLISAVANATGSIVHAYRGFTVADLPQHWHVFCARIEQRSRQEHAERAAITLATRAAAGGTCR